MYDQKTLIAVIKMQEVCGSRRCGCFGSFDRTLGDNDSPGTWYPRSSAEPTVVARYESFTDPETGETLHRPVA